MIKKVCDKCGKDLQNDHHSNIKFVTNCGGSDIHGVIHPVADANSRNRTHLCLHCTIDSINKLDDRNSSYVATPLKKEEVFALNDELGYFEFGDAQGEKSLEFARAIENLHGIK